jgi:hypothetical protein
MSLAAESKLGDGNLGFYEIVHTDGVTCTTHRGRTLRYTAGPNFVERRQTPDASLELISQGGERQHAKPGRHPYFHPQAGVGVV